MEYEIEDETVLFDASTNPSLERKSACAVRDLRPHDLRRLQKGEVIPDEEDLAA